MFIPQTGLDYLKNKSSVKSERLVLDIDHAFKLQRLSYLEGKLEVLKQYNENNNKLGEIQTTQFEIHSIVNDK